MKPVRRHFAIYPINTPVTVLRGYGIRERMRPGMVCRPQGIDVFLLVFFYDEVMIRLQNELRLFPPKSFIVWEPEMAHEFGNSKQAWSHSWLLCGGTRFAEHIREQSLPIQTVRPLANSLILERYLLNIEEELMHNAYPNNEIIGNALHSCIIALGRAINPLPSYRAIPDAYLAVKYHLDTHYTERVTLTELARQTNQSIPRFCMSFRNYFGVPPITYAIQMRMHEAAYLLRDKNLTITEVAQKLGYSDLYYFSRQFRKHYGISPRQMRRKSNTMQNGVSC